MKNTIIALEISPHAVPKVIEIKNDLKSLQTAVAGNIEVAYPFIDDIALIMNDEGKFNGMPLNRALYTPDGELYDIVAGKFLVVGLTEENFCSLSDSQIKTYQELFHTPELFAWVNQKIVVIPDMYSCN